MGRKQIKSFLIVGFLLHATLALAVTVAGLLAQANGLSATYTDLQQRADACPGGTCSDRDAILAGQAQADAAFTQLQADRESLNPCGNCQELDAKIGVVGTQRDDLKRIIDWWEDVS